MTQRGEEMKKLIEAWTSSKKYKKLKREIDTQKRELRKIAGLDKEKLLEYVQAFGVSKKKLQKLIADVIEFDQLSKEEQAHFDWILELATNKVQLEEMYLDLIRTLLTWTTYEFIYSELEEFEICSQLNQVIEIEKKQFLETATEVFGPSEEYQTNLHIIDQEIKDLILK